MDTNPGKRVTTSPRSPKVHKRRQAKHDRGASHGSGESGAPGRIERTIATTESNPAAVVMPAAWAGERARRRATGPADHPPLARRLPSYLPSRRPHLRPSASSAVPLWAPGPQVFRFKFQALPKRPVRICAIRAVGAPVDTVESVQSVKSVDPLGPIPPAPSIVRHESMPMLGARRLVRTSRGT